MPRNYDRTVTDAIQMIIHAKHKDEEVKPVTQAFYFPSVQETLQAKESLKLMDVDESFIKLLEDGDSLIFKGDLDEKLVLCTDDATYEVKEGEISNSLVLTPNVLFNTDLDTVSNNERTVQEIKIAGICHNYLELRATYPRLGKLRKLLSAASYKGPEFEEEMSNKGYYLSELLDTIQCSRSQLLDDLQNLMACCIEDKWRLLHIEYESRMLSYVINLLEEQGLEAVERSSAQRILNTLIPHFILDHILTHFAHPHDSDSEKYILREDKVCRSFAEMLLRAGEGKFRHNEFMMAWNSCLSPGMKADLNHLRGLALVEKEGLQQEVIHLYPEYELPENIAERFRLLFKRKTKWTLEEIQPYIEKLATKSLNVNSMLTKFCRPSTHNGMRVFGARHAN